jgi:nucleoside-diphosphate-sugar epimerase
MKTLVLGATGYLGRRLMPRLRDAEAAPRVDLADPVQASRVLSQWRGDAIVNLAGPVPKRVEPWDEGARTLTAHARIAMNIARALSGRVCRVVHVSSATVYGTPETLPVAETHPRNPIAPYAVGKVLAEDALSCLEDVWLLRVGGLYSNERQEGGLYHFLRAAKEGRKIQITATNPVVWEVLHVDDAAEAIVRALEIRGGGPVNVSTGEPIDLVGIAKRIGARYGAEVEDVARVVHPVFRADTSKLERCFGWAPASLDERLDQWWHAL